MTNEIESKPLFRFAGSYEEFLSILDGLINEIDFNGRPYLFEEVRIGHTYTIGVWVQDPLGENERSWLFEDGNAYEAVFGLFLTYENNGYKVVLAPELVNTRRDLMGQPCPPMIRYTRSTLCRQDKEIQFIDALEERSKQLNKWQPIKDTGP